MINNKLFRRGLFLLLAGLALAAQTKAQELLPWERHPPESARLLQLEEWQHRTRNVMAMRWLWAGSDRQQPLQHLLRMDDWSREDARIARLADRAHRDGELAQDTASSLWLMLETDRFSWIRRIAAGTGNARAGELPELRLAMWEAANGGMLVAAWTCSGDWRIWEFRP